MTTVASKKGLCDWWRDVCAANSVRFFVEKPASSPLPKSSSLRRQGSALISLVALSTLLLTGCTSLAAPDVDPTDLELVEGQVLYQNNCSRCHGATGNGGVGERLNGGLVDEVTNAEVKTLLKEGKNQMPSFEDKLDADQQDAVIRYLREIISKQ